MDPEALDLAVERRHFHAQQLCRPTLIAARTLERVADQLGLVALHLFLKPQPRRLRLLLAGKRFNFT